MKLSSIMQALAGLLGVATAGNTTAKRDVHAHYLPDFYSEALRDAGHEPGPDGMPYIPGWNVDEQLLFMKAQNIEKVYLSISSPGVYLSVPSKDATTKAIKLARQVNEYASKLKADYPDKFGFFASLPLPDVDAAIEEVKYCFEELDPKPDGIVLLSNAYGLYFGDKAMEPLYDVLNELEVTIFEHPAGPCTEYNAEKYHINGSTSDISPEKWRAMNKPVSTRQFTSPMLEYPFETARAFTDLLISKVPQRFPNIQWILPHSGGSIVSTIDRLVQFSILYPGSLYTEASIKSILEKNFFFDLAGPWPVESAIPSLLRWVDYKKIMVGTDTPFTPYIIAGKQVAAFEESIDKVFDDQAQAGAVRRGNAKELLG